MSSPLAVLHSSGYATVDSSRATKEKKSSRSQRTSGSAKSSSACAADCASLSLREKV
jgi:hypothetical protein